MQILRFTQLFVRGIGAAKPAKELDHRITNLNDFFTYSVYTNICRLVSYRHDFDIYYSIQ